MIEKQKKTVMIWFKVYDLMYMYSNDTQKDDFNALVNKADIIYAADKESYQSACERVYDDKVRILPEGIDNTEDATEAIKSDLLRYEITDYVGFSDEIEIITPERVKAEFLGDKSNRGPIEYNKMNGDLGPLDPEELDEMAEKLPGRIGEQLKGLVGAIDEVNQTAEEIFQQYALKCKAEGIEEAQAKEEASEYMKGKIPAAEFVAPVGILDSLKDI